MTEPQLAALGLLFALAFAFFAYRHLVAEARRCETALAEHNRLVRKTIGLLDPNDPDAE